MKQNGSEQDMGFFGVENVFLHSALLCVRALCKLDKAPVSSIHSGVAEVGEAEGRRESRRSRRPQR